MYRDFSNASKECLLTLVSGVEDKGEALGAVYASSHYSDDLIASYNYYADKLKGGNYTAHDIEMCKTMFELSKAAKIEELNNILMLTRDEFHEEIRDQIYTLVDMEWNTYNIDSIPNISQIDSDFCNVNSGGGRIQLKMEIDLCIANFKESLRKHG